MKTDETKSAATEAACEEDLRNRREFFNGLGKWSLAIIAAVSSLTGYGTRARASREDAKLEPDAQRPAWTASDDRSLGVRVAGYFKRRPHGDYTKIHNEHGDFTYHRSIQ